MSASSQFLLFELAGRRWAIPAARVKSVMLAMQMAPLPDAPSLVEGVIDVAGRTIPVLDLRRWLRLPAVRLAASQHFVVCEAGPREVALRVDRALGLHELPDAAAWKPFADANDGQRVVGALRIADELVVVQDLDGLLEHAGRVLAALEAARPLAVA